MSGRLDIRTIVAVILLATLMLLPLYAELSGNRFLLTLFTRIVILALVNILLYADSVC